jgi:hypothetical protein
MATYNVTDGTGGLDASTRFEQDRPEVSASRTGGWGGEEETYEHPHAERRY